jgi:hypothetical protein
VLRLLGFLFVAIGVIVAVLDWRAAGRTVDAFVFRDIGTVWFALHRESLQLAQPAVERHISVWLWQKLLQPALLLPAAPTLMLAGLALLLLGLSGGRRRRYR